MERKPVTRRRGFTLIELMVVMAIMSVLLSLTITGLNKVREAAKRTVCADRLRMVGIATTNYWSAYHKLPPGQFNFIQPHEIRNTVTTPTLPNNRDRRCWMQELLPFIDRNADYQQASAHMNNGGASWSIPGRERKIESLMCPSDPARGKNRTRTDIYGNYNGVYPPEISQGFHGNYVMCAGSTYFNPVDDRFGLRLDGLFFPLSQIRARDVKDGWSNTIMGGEIVLTPDVNYPEPEPYCKVQPSPPWPPGYIVRDDREDIHGRYYNNLVGNSLFTTLRPPNHPGGDLYFPPVCLYYTFIRRTEDEDQRVDVNCCAITNCVGNCCKAWCRKPERWRPWFCMTEHEYDNQLRGQFLRSHHPGCAHALFGDGSARPISNEINERLFQALGSRAGEEVIQEDY